MRLQTERLRSTGPISLAIFIGVWLTAPVADGHQDAPKAGPGVIRSARSGPWSAAESWEGGRVPAEGARVQVRAGHTVVYDVVAGRPIRSIHVAGVLTFAPDQETRLDVGLIKIQAGDDWSEDGFDCDAHLGQADPAMPRPALLVGTEDRPIDPGRTATIRLVYVEGMDRESCPALVCCGGRMDFHGAPMDRTWLKLGATAQKGDRAVIVDGPVSGWRVGDRVIVTATEGDRGTGGTRRAREGRKAPPSTGRSKDYGYRTDAEPGVPVQTEERIIRAIDGARLTLDAPLEHAHLGTGDYRGEVANLSRNVVVESADPEGVRGHTMYHRGSSASIRYAEFRHLGKEGLLGKYSLHFHRAGDSMRGSSVVGASIWESRNRWITIHGTNFLVVRDCVGYQSVGHGFFLEDGTEVHNVLDRNLAVQAFHAKPLPDQVLPFDQNEGAGFWWANSLNTFTRNVAVENDRYGYRFEATTTSRLPSLALPVRQPDGSRRGVDIRTLPFVRFDANESHCDGKYGLDLGEGVDRVGPDARHPFVVRGLKVWEIHYAIRPESPMLLMEDTRIHRAIYGIYHPNYDHHVYRNLTISETHEEPFNRGLDDESVQYGPLAVDGLTIAGVTGYAHSVPLIQISDNNPTGAATSYFRRVVVADRRDHDRRAIVNVGGGTRTPPTTPRGVPIYLLDYYGRGRHAKVVSTRARDLLADDRTYREEPPLTGDLSRVAEVRDLDFPRLLDPASDLPPTTVITRVVRLPERSLLVEGTASSNGTIKTVRVGEREATATDPNFARWQVVIPDDGSKSLTARAEDEAGNIEATPHVRLLDVLPVLLAGAIGAEAAPVFKAGFAERDITPEIGMEAPGGYGKVYHKSIHDPCKVRAAVFDDGRSRVAIVGVDALSIRRETVRKVRRAIQDRTGIPAASILIGASHSHSSGPLAGVVLADYEDASPLVRRLASEHSTCADPRYVARVEEALIEAVCAANDHRAEARGGVGKGSEPTVAFNRRFLMRDGRTITHPGLGNPEIVEPAGPVDPEVGVIGAWETAKPEKLLGCVVNFACHATTSPSGISANYIHYLEKVIQGYYGKDCVVVFLAGASGDVTQVDNRSPYRNPDGDRWAQLVGGKVGAEALKVLLTMERGLLVPIEARNKVWEIPRRAPSADRVRRALEIVEGERPKGDPTEWTFAKETVLLDALIRKAPAVEAEVQAVQVGPAVFVANPSEYFCRFGLEIKAESGFPFTFPVSLANGIVGYVPTEDAFGPHGGGYETRLTSYSNLEITAGTRMRDAGIALARELKPGAVPEPPRHPPFNGKPWSYGDVAPQKE